MKFHLCFHFSGTKHLEKLHSDMKFWLCNISLSLSNSKLPLNIPCSLNLAMFIQKSIDFIGTFFQVLCKCIWEQISWTLWNLLLSKQMARAERGLNVGASLFLIVFITFCRIACYQMYISGTLISCLWSDVFILLFSWPFTAFLILVLMESLSLHVFPLSRVTNEDI